MSQHIQQRGQKFQLRVKHALLGKPFFFTFPERDQAAAYGSQLEALLDRGIVPVELLDSGPAGGAKDDPLVFEMISLYERECPSVSRTDRELTGYLRQLVPGVRKSQCTYAFAVETVQGLKRKHRLAPGTIRARIGCLGRVFDFYAAYKRGTVDLSNPWRMLKQGYSTYNSADRESIAATDKVDIEDLAEDSFPSDIKRDRRISGAEDARIRKTLAGEKWPGRERSFPPDSELTMLYSLIVETGCRLREAYTTRREYINPRTHTLQVDGTKKHGGGIKLRHVPLKPALQTELVQYLSTLPAGPGLLFPSLWNGSRDAVELRRTTTRLSVRFKSVFDSAGVSDLREHDLRHEATCRWVELRRPDGSWAFDPASVARIMGWGSLSLFMRYASLRGEDMAAWMYPDADPVEGK